jgi:tetratricopeptide (TPR) repeat protein
MDNPVPLQAAPDSEARLALLSLPDWTKLLRHFELGEGFALIVILLGDSTLAPVCREELDLWLLARQRPRVFPVPIESPEDLTNLPEKLLSIEFAPDGPVWVDGTGPRDQYESAWTRAALKLNLTRNTIVDRFSTPLILVGPTWVREILRDTAPDFWSIRTFVAEILVPRSVAAPTNAPPRAAALEFTFSGDPDFTLRQAERLRGLPGRERQLATLLVRAGRELMARGRMREASAPITEALELSEAAVAQNREDRGAQRNLSIIYDDLGDLMTGLGKTDNARKYYSNEVSVIERLIEREPDHTEHLTQLAIAFGKMGDLLWTLRAFEQAHEMYLKSIDILERLVREQPDDIDYLQTLAASYDRFSRLMESAGALDAARPFLEKSLSILQRLVSQDPSYAPFLYNLSTVTGKMGDLASATGAADEARNWYRKALEIQQRLVNENPHHAACLEQLIATLHRIGTPEQLAEAETKLAQLTQPAEPVTNPR